MSNPGSVVLFQHFMSKSVVWSEILNIKKKKKNFRERGLLINVLRETLHSINNKKKLQKF